MYAQSYGLEPAHHAGIGTITTSSPIMLGEQKASKSEIIFGNIIESCEVWKLSIDQGNLEHFWSRLDSGSSTDGSAPQHNIHNSIFCC